MNFNVRVPDEMAARFDAWASTQGGRSPSLRRLIDQAASPGAPPNASEPRLLARPVKLTVRLTGADALGLETAAAGAGLTANAWAAALIRRRLHKRPTFSPTDETALVAIQIELRRLSVNVNQIARTLNETVPESRVLHLKMVDLDDLRRELRSHMTTLRDAIAGNLAHWQVEA